MASVQGWGRLTWGSGAWNEYAPVEATGEGLTSSTEDVTIVTIDNNFSRFFIIFFILIILLFFQINFLS